MVLGCLSTWVLGFLSQGWASADGHLAPTLPYGPQCTSFYNQTSSFPAFQLSSSSFQLSCWTLCFSSVLFQDFSNFLWSIVQAFYLIYCSWVLANKQGSFLSYSVTINFYTVIFSPLPCLPQAKIVMLPEIIYLLFLARFASLGSRSPFHQSKS